MSAVTSRGRKDALDKRPLLNRGALTIATVILNQAQQHLRMMAGKRGEAARVIADPEMGLTRQRQRIRKKPFRYADSERTYDPDRR